MARIPYFDRTLAEGKVKASYEKLPDANIFRMVGNLGDLMDGFTRMGHQILNKTELSPALREIAILRVAANSNCRYEAYQHEPIAWETGVSKAKTQAILTRGDLGLLAPLERLVVEFTDDVVHNVRAGDATFVPLHGELGDKRTAELLVIVGYYMMVARVLETLDVDLDGAPVNPEIVRV